MSIKRKLTGFVAPLFAGALALTTVGCSTTQPGSGGAEDPASGGEPASAAVENSDISVGFVISGINGIFADLIDILQKDADERGMTFTVKEAPEVSKKITAIENFVASGADVIIVHVDDPSALQPAVSEAQAAGVKIIAYDMDLETSDAFAGVDNHTFGYAIGKNAAEWINANYESSEEVPVGVLNYPDFSFLVEREEGILDALNELAPKAKVVATTKAGYKNEGVDAGETWLQSNPEIRVVVGINDDGVLGLYEAFNAANVGGDEYGLFAGDALDEAIAAIDTDGIYRATVSTNLLKTAPKFIDAAEELAKTGTVKEHDIMFPLTPVTKENLQEYLEGNL
ncbi:MAG: sugar ABC transporter substrate-binding protein [Scrofimicrobium sp.]